jgi:O-antigen/teichoic acid export membrane protein
MKITALKGFDEAAFGKYLKNTGWLMLGRVGALVIKMGTSILVANYLLPKNNGILNSSISYIFLFAALASLGLDSFIVKELHENPSNRDRILGTSFVLKLAAGIACVPLIYLFWLFFPLTGIPYVFVLILSVAGIFQSLTIIDSYFQSQVKSKYIMQVQITGNVISAGIKLALIFVFSAKLIFFFYAFSLDILLLSLGYFYTYKKQGLSVLKWNYDKQLAVRLLHLSWPLIISGVMVSVYMKIDVIMLKEMLGKEGATASGAYATVVMFSEALNFVPVVIVSSLFPAILNARRDDPQRYQKRLQNLFDLMVWLSLLFAIFITLASPFIYSFFKPEFAAAAPVLALHVWGSLFVFLGVASSQFLITEGYHKLTFVRTGIGAIVNILLNLILIPKLGMMGAAVATLIAYCTATFVIILIPKTRKQGIMMLKSLFLVTAFQKIFKS